MPVWVDMVILRFRNWFGDILSKKKYWPIILGNIAETCDHLKGYINSRRKIIAASASEHIWWRWDSRWASLRQHLSLGFQTKWDSNQPAQLQRLARKMKFRCSKLRYGTFQNGNNKGAGQTARMRRLVCACVVRKPPKTGFLASRPRL